MLFFNETADKVEIIDFSARLVLESKHTDSIHLQGLSHGKYMVSIETTEGKLILPFSKL